MFNCKMEKLTEEEALDNEGMTHKVYWFNSNRDITRTEYYGNKYEATYNLSNYSTYYFNGLASEMEKVSRFVQSMIWNADLLPSEWPESYR